MTKKKRSVLLSVLITVLCLALVAGGTYALFSDEVRFEEHLQAGTLDITLFRTKLVKKALDEKGFLVSNEDNPDTRRLKYSEPNPENVFGISSGEKIVPGTKYEATFEIQNNSDVAFGYWLEIVCKNKAEGENLAKQIKVTVNTDNSAFIGEGLIVTADNSEFIKIIGIGDKDEFTVTVEFLDSHVKNNGIESNDLAQGQKLSFDLVVKAMQVVDEPQNP